LRIANRLLPALDVSREQAAKANEAAMWMAVRENGELAAGFADGRPVGSINTRAPV
jgi:hypothetical protein